MKRPFLLTVALLLLAAGVTYAQTGDGLPPANEGICDELMWATPGLFGLCVAFSEAQDCVPAFGTEDPFLNCTPSNSKLLVLYNQKKKASDPPMPGIAVGGCPCWSADELNRLRWPDTNDKVWCQKDFDSWPLTGLHHWAIALADHYQSNLQTALHETWGPECVFFDFCDEDLADCGGTSWRTTRFFSITEVEFALCQAQLDTAGADRGISCFIE